MPRKPSEKKSNQVVEPVVLDAATVLAFREALIGWFEKEGRDYPWRRTTDPYAILVSEAMLQQTRIATVLERKYFERWMETFPDLATLASADEEEILELWQGLGYYNRARNLQRTAERLVEDREGDFPRELDALLALPGIGRYTAGAVLSFAFGIRATVVDGNVVRVLARWFGDDDPIDAPGIIDRYWARAEVLTPNEGVREFNSAIMELGQRICVRGEPRCSECPVAENCSARRKGNASSLPRKEKRTKTSDIVELVGILAEGDRVLLAKETGGRRRGLWKLPELSGEEAADWHEAFRFAYAITRFRVELRIFAVPTEGTKARDWREACRIGQDDSGLAWHHLDRLPPLGAPYRKALERWFSGAEESLFRRETGE